MTHRKIIWFTVLAAFLALLLPIVRSSFFQYGRWLYILLFSLFLSFLLTPLARWLALRFDVVDSPHARKIHQSSTPLLGGAAIVIAFSAALIANMILDFRILLLIGGGLIIALVSLKDDCREISASTKLIVQVVVVLIMIFNGIILDLFPHSTYWGYGLNVLFTLVWIVGMTNAMNFMDGMDGLATGLSAVTALFMGIIAVRSNQPTMGWIAIALVGSCLGFLPYNFKPSGRQASIFLGDTGSTYLGFTLATLAVIGEWDSNPIVSFSAPVLIFWIPIFDMSYITVERVITGKTRTLKQWIDYVGKDHLHHRLYDLLGDKRKAVLMILFCSATLGISAIVLREAHTEDGILLVVQAFLLAVIFSILEYTGRNRQ